MTAILTKTVSRDWTVPMCDLKKDLEMHVWKSNLRNCVLKGNKTGNYREN